MKKWNWTIGRQLGVTVGIVLVLLSLVVGVSLWTSHHQERMARGVMERIQASKEALLVQRFAIEQYQSLADNIINRHTNRTEYGESRKGFVEANRKLQENAQTAEEKAWAEKLTVLGQNLEKVYDQQLIPLVVKYGAEANAEGKIKVADEISKLDDSIDALVAEIKDLAEKCSAAMKQEALDNQGRFEASARLDFMWILVLGLSALVVGLVGSAWVVRHVTRQITALASDLAGGARETATASGQVSQASRTLAEGASDQAASLEETSAALEELASMTHRNSEAAQQAKDLASQTRSSADLGTKDMVEMQAAMKDLEASSGSVSKIVKEIDEIAFQTNILALNAAVEAARAGEAGMGFAVVADEVRNLAQRSAMAAKETASKIEDAVSKSTRGVELSAKVTVNFEDIAAKARQVDQVVGEIANASKEQAQGIQQVNTAVTQMDKVTQSNAASAEESASASTQLHAQAKAVTNTVSALLSLVGRTMESYAAEELSGPTSGKASHREESISPARRPAGASKPDSAPGPSSETALPKDAASFGDIPMPAAPSLKDFKDF